jgi:hypothetical protein
MSEVTRFMLTSLDKVLPAEIWGCETNKKVIYSYVKLFLELRYHEELTLHQILQQVKVCILLFPRISWN